MSDHDDVVQRQFGAQAAAYLSSAVHAQGEEFALLRDALAGRPEARVLDLGCGAGHVSFQVAALAGEVVAYDLSAEMLAVVAQSAAERGMANIRTEQGKAESLPFADGEFDFVFSRYSTHHWRDVGLALREVAEHLGVSAKTVSNHVSLLKQKLQVSTQAELVHRAIDSGVLRLGLPLPLAEEARGSLG
ncbi:methyltransferase domain-containing protein [Pseudomonas aeruginosa]|nr:methyltransferase domain-containing protein [Pseudomonas aeruginosa]MBF2980625.1 methyltransferase domain-containing protein [Pseudomonas aeruginosa]